MHSLSLPYRTNNMKYPSLLSAPNHWTRAVAVYLCSTRQHQAAGSVVAHKNAWNRIHSSTRLWETILVSSHSIMKVPHLLICCAAAMIPSLPKCYSTYSTVGRQDVLISILRSPIFSKNQAIMRIGVFIRQKSINGRPCWRAPCVDGRRRPHSSGVFNIIQHWFIMVALDAVRQQTLFLRAIIYQHISAQYNGKQINEAISKKMTSSTITATSLSFSNDFAGIVQTKIKLGFQRTKRQKKRARVSHERVYIK